jgi:hypothetical protein
MDSRRLYLELTVLLKILYRSVVFFCFCFDDFFTSSCCFSWVLGYGIVCCCIDVFVDLTGFG